MKRIVFTGILGAIVGIAGTLAFLNCRHPSAVAMNDPLKSKILFSTSETEGYFFPTHDNLLIMDRSNAEISEAFIVQIAPGKFTHRHVHDDTEQLFYILSGKGKLNLERTGHMETFELLPANFVHVPRNCYHQTFCEGTDTLKYLAIDCFPHGHNPAELTWDDHARAVCKMNNWDYNEARKIKTK
jgi:oxalate decarboxylase/phosphoglucose isomerase-like protein (cupin superfamily)